MHLHKLHVRLVVEAAWNRSVTAVQALNGTQTLLADLRLQLDLITDAELGAKWVSICEHVYFAIEVCSSVVSGANSRQHPSTHAQPLRQELVLVAALILLR